MQDEKLLRKLRTDPEQGMKLLLEHYVGLVYAVVKSKLQADVFCLADIEACVADTFSEFFCDLHKFDPARGSIKAWLCVIAKHNALDHLRRHYAQADTVSLDDDSVSTAADDCSVEGDFEDKSLRAELLTAIKNLGEPDREILIRKFYLAQSSREIADILGLSISNVDTRTHRAIQKLRSHFGGD